MADADTEVTGKQSVLALELETNCGFLLIIARSIKD